MTIFKEANGAVTFAISSDSLSRGASAIDTALSAGQSISDLLIQLKTKALSARDDGEKNRRQVEMKTQGRTPCVFLLPHANRLLTRSKLFQSSRTVITQIC